MSITINGIRNRLSGSEAPYPNNNDTFYYMISSNEDMDALDIMLSLIHIFNTSSFLKQESGLPNMENHSEIIKMKLLDKPLTMCFHNLNLTFVAVFKLSNRKELL